MSLTYTPEGRLGSLMPDFNLPTVDGGRFDRAALAGVNTTVIAFICNHCPYVRAIEHRLIQLNLDLQAGGGRLVAICSNDPADYPEDAPGELRRRSRELGYGFPYLIDETQAVARTFGAVCTPDLYVYDQQNLLVYRGRLDDSWKNPAQVKNRELFRAVEAVRAGNPVNPQQNPSMGCSIKWKKG